MKMSGKQQVINNENREFSKSSLFNRNNIFIYIQMKLPDSAFNIDVKNVILFKIL